MCVYTQERMPPVGAEEPLPVQKDLRWEVTRLLDSCRASDTTTTTTTSTTTTTTTTTTTYDCSYVGG